MIDQKSLLGVLNTDDANDVIPQGHHKDAKNIVFRGSDGDLKPQGVFGTREVTNEFLPNTGVNELIFAKYDQINQRVFEFQYNSLGEHGIYVFNVLDETYEVLLKIGAATDGDILGFDLDTALHSVDIVYGDTVSGDILTYTDTLKRPTAIGIDKFLDDPYTITKRLFIDVAKPQPLMPPQCTYENDTTVAVNNCKNSLFQFAVAHTDVNNFLTLLSQGSEVPLPYLPGAQTSDTDTSKNARIAVYVQTGDANIRKITIAVKQTSGVINSNPTNTWLRVIVLDKDELSIADNSIYKYLFFNDGLYPALDPKYTTPTQDFVPNKAGCQTLLRGSVLTYGNITEGLDLPVPDVDSTISDEPYPYSTENGLLFFASQTGLKSGGSGDTIVVYLTGVGTNTAGDPTTLVNSEAIYKVDARNAAGSSVAFQYDNVTQSQTVTNIFNGISAAAVIAGWTEVSRTTNTMTLSYSTDVTLLGNGIIRSAGTDLADTDVIFAYCPESNYSYGGVYRDEQGHISSVFTDVAFNIITPVESTTQMPLIQLEISHRPPLYAVSWSPVRSPNLTYGKRLNWISFAAFTGIISVNNEQYAYIDIQNIATYNSDIKSTSSTVNYDFAPGDRIRFKSRVQFDGTVTALTGKDYEVLGVVNAITLADSSKKFGTFVQIKYPTADIDVNFKFDGTFEFMNYEILLYNYTQHSGSEDTPYFEFGRQYGIGNAGTVNAYHIGQEQSQTANLATPALVSTYEGDFFLRKRLVPTGMAYEHTLQGYENGWNDYTTIPIDVTGTPVTTTYYEIRSEPFQNAGLGSGSYPTFAADQYYYNKSASAQRVRIQVKMVFTNDVNLTAFQIIAKLITVTPTVTTKTIYPNAGVLQPNIDHTAEIDTIIDVPAATKLSLIMYKSGSKVWVTSAVVKFDVLNQKSINIVEDTFSDIYGIKTNSNSKPSAVVPDAQETTYANLYRWSLAFNQGTNINELNRFYAANQDVTDLSKGAIQRLSAMGNQLNFYLERAIGATGIFAKFIQDSNNTGTLTTTDEIIARNNIQYRKGEYGIGKHPESLITSDIADYLVDPIRGRELRNAADGVTDLTKIYKGQYVISPLLVQYNKEWATATGGTAKILGCYDFFEEQAMRLLQAGVNGENSIDAYMYSFNEKRNAFCSFYDFNPEFILGIENKILTWVEGVQYIHDNTTDYCKFYGTQYYPSITLVFNDKKNIKKTFNAAAYQGNQFWVSDTNGDILTSQPNPQTGFTQISQLKAVDYEIMEGLYYAGLLRDANSGLDAQVALVEGDYLKGEWVQIKFTYKGSEFAYMYLPYVNYSASPRNF